MAQIRAEEVSQLQYMLELKFSAQGLDKKVRTICSAFPCTVCPHILQYYLVLYTSCLSFLRTSWVRVILTWSLPRRIQTAATPPLTALRYHFIPYHTTLTLPFWIRDRSLYWLTYLYQLILRSLHRPAKALSHSIPSEASLPILVPF